MRNCDIPRVGSSFLFSGTKTLPVCSRVKLQQAATLDGNAYLYMGSERAVGGNGELARAGKCVEISHERY